ncbi:hypothetical protein P8767_08795 [Peribacillus frigoritolerans]|nr:hypothetical protein [Peribacillus frigoritolerans]
MITLDQLVPACKMEIKEDYRVYKSSNCICAGLVHFYHSECCTESKDLQKVVALHIGRNIRKKQIICVIMKSNPIKNQKGFGMKPFRNLFVCNLRPRY